MEDKDEKGKEELKLRRRNKVGMSVRKEGSSPDDSIDKSAGGVPPHLSGYLLVRTLTASLGANPRDEFSMKALKDGFLEMKPSDVTEGIWSSQIVVCNHEAMNLLQKSQQYDNIMHKKICTDLAIKLMKTGIELVGAMEGRRARLDHNMFIGDINIGDGSKAIVTQIQRQESDDDDNGDVV